MTTLQAYMICALWASIGDNEEPLDENFRIEDIAPETRARMDKDCAEFVANNARDITLSSLTDDEIGHAFWLSRNGHGSGFFDRYSQTTCANYQREQEIAVKLRDFSTRDALNKTCNCPYHACQRLQENARKVGSFDLYIGDDKQLHGV